MASSSKKKTTFAKLNREQKLRERRETKEARKAQRKLEASMPLRPPPWSTSRSPTKSG